MTKLILPLLLFLVSCASHNNCEHNTDSEQIHIEREMGASVIR